MLIQYRILCRPGEGSSELIPESEEGKRASQVERLGLKSIAFSLLSWIWGRQDLGPA
jgi:hypothetical protein